MKRVSTKQNLNQFVIFRLWLIFLLNSWVSLPPTASPWGSSSSCSRPWRQSRASGQGTPPSFSMFWGRCLIGNFFIECCYGLSSNGRETNNGIWRKTGLFLAWIPFKSEMNLSTFFFLFYILATVELRYLSREHFSLPCLFRTIPLLCHYVLIPCQKKYK